MAGKLNLYGDEHRHTTGRHGTDIASQRIDELDRLCLTAIIDGTLDDGVAIDFGCGSGYQGLRMAALGRPTIMVDPFDISDRVEALRRAFPGLGISFHPVRIEAFLEDYAERNVSIVFSQRTIHYLCFEQALRVLQASRRLMTKKSKMFLSASGLHSELGVGYPDSSKEIDGRFATLHPETAKKHSILEKVCLYGEADMRQLGQLAGFAPERVWTSEFGNVKAVFRPA